VVCGWVGGGQRGGKGAGARQQKRQGYIQLGARRGVKL
jgi:hypothetical protein